MKSSDLVWKKQYVTGIEEIDLQHKYFVNLIGRLSVELATNQDIAYKSRLIDELVRYAKFHFISEENLMMKYAYPDLDKHMKSHSSIIEKLTNQIISNNPDKLVEFLVTWFNKHTAIEDQKFSHFVNKQSG